MTVVSSIFASCLLLRVSRISAFVSRVVLMTGPADASGSLRSGRLVPLVLLDLGNRLASPYLFSFVLRSSFALEEFRARCGSRTSQ